MDQKNFAELPFARKRDLWMRNLLKAGKADLPAGAKIVGMRLALYMHEGKQWAHPSYDELGSECDLGVRIVQAHTLALEKHGWIVAKRKRNVGNIYELRYWWVQ